MLKNESRNKSINFQILHKKQVSAFCCFKMSKTKEKDRERVSKCATSPNTVHGSLNALLIETFIQDICNQSNKSTKDRFSFKRNIEFLFQSLACFDAN